jgi:hypothetical protein
MRHLQPVLDNLTTLKLCLHLYGREASLPGPEQRGHINQSLHVQTFLSHCPNLEHLELDAKHPNVVDEQILTCLSTAADPPTPLSTATTSSPPCHMYWPSRSLTSRVSLSGIISFTEPTFQNLILKFPGLAT